MSTVLIICIIRYARVTKVPATLCSLARANDLLTSPSLNPALGAWSWPGPWRSAADPTREQGGEQPPNPRRPYLAPWTLAASDVMRSRDQMRCEGIHACSRNNNWNGSSCLAEMAESAEHQNCGKQTTTMTTMTMETVVTERFLKPAPLLVPASSACACAYWY